MLASKASTSTRCGGAITAPVHCQSSALVHGPSYSTATTGPAFHDSQPESRTDKL